MPRIAFVSRARAGAELREAHVRASRASGLGGRVGPAPQVLQCLSQRPALLVAFAEGYGFAGWGGRLPRALRELTALVVSRENECFY
jgi:alkylhydroperoxidase family enzyme